MKTITQKRLPVLIKQTDKQTGYPIIGYNSREETSQYQSKLEKRQLNPFLNDYKGVQCE